MVDMKEARKPIEQRRQAKLRMSIELGEVSAGWHLRRSFASYEPMSAISVM